MSTAANLVPGTEPWLRKMTASKVAAILGVSKWDSPRSMWHKMRNDLPPETQTAVQSRGHYLEPAILAWWQDQHVDELLVVRRQPVYELEDWAAATPDAEATFRDQRMALVEAKSARELEQWGTPGTDEIPAEYLVQCYWQMHVSGIHRCYVPVIGAFLDFSEYVVDYDPVIGAELEAKCLAFVDALAWGEEPDLDGHPATYAAINKVYRVMDDSTVELPIDVAVEYLDAINDRKDAEARERLAKARVVEAIGEHRYGDVGGVRVARRQPNKTGFQINQVAKSSTDLSPASPEGTTDV